MKKLFLFPVLLLVAAGCSDVEKKKEEKKNKEEQYAGTMCFYRTAGKENQDTAIVQLIFADDKSVSGEMMFMPFEKDWRVGTLQGQRKGDEVMATWFYMQEGMEDSANVVFKLADGNIVQKNWSYDAETGHEYIQDNADFTTEYIQADCEQLPKHGFIGR